MPRKVDVIYGWREMRNPRQWLYSLHKVFELQPREDWRTGLFAWMTRQEVTEANLTLSGSGYQWVDAGEKPRQAK